MAANLIFLLLDNECLFPLQIHMMKPNLQSNGTWRQRVFMVLDHKGKKLINGIRNETLEISLVLSALSHVKTQIQGGGL